MELLSDYSPSDILTGSVDDSLHQSKVIRMYAYSRGPLIQISSHKGVTYNPINWNVKQLDYTHIYQLVKGYVYLVPI